MENNKKLSGKNSIEASLDGWLLLNPKESKVGVQGEAWSGCYLKLEKLI